MLKKFTSVSYFLFGFLSVVLEEGSTNMKLIIHDVDDNEEMVKRLNLLKEDLNIEIIYSNGAEKGSIILFIDVKNRVVLDDGMFKGAPSTKNIFNFAMFTCDLYTQTYAAIASATGKSVL